MKYSTVLFDLDGTLLPLDQDEFIKEYFRLMINYLSKKMGNAEKYAPALKKAVFAMMKNDGTMTNEDLFNRVFEKESGEKTPPAEIFDSFYDTEFIKLKDICGFDPKAKETVSHAKALGFRVALATNPAFPIFATHERIRWAGLEPEDFELVTAYEKSSFCKPDPRYYLEVARSLAVAPEECLMIGNDTLDDMESEKVGMKPFLLTNYLVNRNGLDVEKFQNGSWEDLKNWLSEIAQAPC